MVVGIHMYFVQSLLTPSGQDIKAVTHSQHTVGVWSANEVESRVRAEIKDLLDNMLELYLSDIEPTD